MPLPRLIKIYLNLNLLIKLVFINLKKYIKLLIIQYYYDIYLNLDKENKEQGWLSKKEHKKTGGAEKIYAKITELIKGKNYVKAQSEAERYIEDHPEIDWSWSDDGICDNTFTKSREKWIERKRIEIIKALQIQRHWRNCISNPVYRLANKIINKDKDNNEKQ